MNYPRLWQQGAWLGLTQAHTFWLGLGLTLLFFAVVFRLVYRHPSARWPLYWPLAVLSPHVMLAVERGNTDLLMFSLLAASVWLVRRSGPFRLVGWVVFLLACLLKLYPIFGIGLVWESRSRHKTWLTAWLVLLFGAYALAIGPELALISAATPRESFDSFGLFVLPDALAASLGVARGGLRTAAGLLLAAAALGVFLKKKPQPFFAGSREAEAFFVVGAGVYMGSYLLGNNFNYRFVFTLFTLPLLLAALGSGRRRWALMTLLLLLVTLYSRFMNPPMGLFFSGKAAIEAAQQTSRTLRLVLEESTNAGLWLLLGYGLLQTRFYRKVVFVSQQPRFLLR